jgi:hypothetical protein
MLLMEKAFGGEAGSMKVWKYKSIKVWKYGSMEVWKYGSGRSPERVSRDQLVHDRDVHAQDARRRRT